MTVVIDTNIFVISLTSKSPYHRIFKALKNQEFNLAVSNDILLEYLEVIETKYSTRAADEFLNLLIELPNVKPINIYYNWNLIKADAEDNKFVDVAVAAAADYLVSEDRHFDVLKRIEFPKVNVIGLHKFMDKFVA